MECLFIGIKTSNCLLHQRCEGIFQIMTNLGAAKKEANSFAKYVWRRYLFNKLSDTIQDSSTGFQGTTQKILARVFRSVIKPIIRDPYRIENRLEEIENKILKLEKANASVSVTNPINYFQKTGNGYGIIFKTAAQLSQAGPQTIDEMFQLGQKLGTLVAMRDSIQDFHLDKKIGCYNPFSSWDKTNILEYYQEHRKKLIHETSGLLNSKIDKEDNSVQESSVFFGIGLYTTATTNPYRLCKKQIQRAKSYILENDTSLVNFFMDSGNQRDEPEDSCSVNCCASSCDECCYIPNNPCEFCCFCCDECIDCCSDCTI